MNKTRLEAFSDGVLAIIITIMVLELKAPHDAAPESLISLIPVFVSYVLSFIYVGIYWNNHHHLMTTVTKVTGGIMWANLHLLFWLSLAPFVTAWAGENNFAPATMALYGFIFLMAAVAYTILQKLIIRLHGSNSAFAAAIGKDIKGKLSLILYIIAIACSFAYNWLAGSLYALVALIWLIPDKRIEALSKKELQSDKH